MAIHGSTVIDGMDKAAAQAELEIGDGAWTDPSADHTASGTTQSVTVGEAVVFGDLLYIKSDGKWWKSDADAAATMPGLRLALEARGITPATETVFEAAATAYTSVAMLSATKAIVCYQDDADGDKGKACILTISDTTITAGDVVEFEAGATTYISVAMLAVDKAIVCYQDDDDDDKGKACILSISETTITAGAVAEFEDATTSHISVALLATDRAIVCYTDGGNSNYGTACILSVADTTITAGTPVVFEAGSTACISVAMLTADRAIVCYQDVGNSYYGTACILSVADTTITAETPVVFEAGGVDYISVAMLADGKPIVCYRDTGNSNYGTARVLSAGSMADPCSMLVMGLVRDDTWDWTVGGIIYASTDAGGLTPTAPSGSADIVQVVGVAYHADKMIFDPSMDMMEIQ